MHMTPNKETSFQKNVLGMTMKQIHSFFRVLLTLFLFFSQNVFFTIGYIHFRPTMALKPISYRNSDLSRIDRKPYFQMNVSSSSVASRMHIEAKHNQNENALKQWLARTPYITYSFMFLNVIIFLAMQFDGRIFQKYAKNNPMIRLGQTYRLLTSIFLHGDIAHLLTNSFSLYSFGIASEAVLGRFKYLLIYLGSGVIANAGTYSLGLSPLSIGCSGSISGLIGAYSYYYYTKGNRYGNWYDYFLYSSLT